MSTCLRLLGNELIRSALDHFRRQVPMLLATKWAGDKDRTEWKLLHPCGNIQPTALAFDNELLSIFHPNSRAAATICECVPEADKRDSEVLTRTSASGSITTICSTLYRSLLSNKIPRPLLA
jgi:hypothetical protein